MNFRIEVEIAGEWFVFADCFSDSAQALHAVNNARKSDAEYAESRWRIMQLRNNSWEYFILA